MLLRSCLTLAAIFGPASTWACGPFLPTEVLSGDASAALNAPRSDLVEALTHFCEPVEQKMPVVSPGWDERKTTLAVDGADLEAAGFGALKAQYLKARETNDLSALPDGLPAEFRLYAQGAIAWRLEQRGRAEGLFRQVLALPAAERRYRSTWAAFMLGRGEHNQGERWYSLVRSLQADGFHDSLGLAATSLGWSAWARLVEDDLEGALKLYLRQVAVGDPSGAASVSQLIRELLRKEGPEALAMAANSAVIRPLVTAHLLSIDDWDYDKSDAGDNARWLAAVEGVGASAHDVADRMAWLAYRTGKVDAAERWLKVADTSPLAEWLRAKLELRAGRIDEAAARLSKVLPDIARISKKFGEIALGEWGAIRLARAGFVEALDAFMRSGDYNDAAYLADRVLTVDELKRYVDTAATGPLSPSLRHLLGRRLMRNERRVEALAYLPEAVREHAKALILQHRIAGHSLVPQAARAKALLAAARITRHHGMELMGTAGVPDEFIMGGNAWSTDRAKARLAVHPAGPLPATVEEQRRLRASVLPINKRFHYRYVAADLTWDASLRMPSNTPETASALCEAGSWIKDGDAFTADRFYKALVNRNRAVPLGREADGLRWFPSQCNIEVNTAIGG